MIYLICPHCGTENEIIDPETVEEPTCELCDGCLEESPSSDEEEEEEDRAAR